MTWKANVTTAQTPSTLLITVELLALLLQVTILGTTVVANFHDLLTLKKPYAEGSSFTSIVVSSRGKFNRLFHIFRWIWEQCMRWTEKNTPIELSIMNALDFSFETQTVEGQVSRITVLCRIQKFYSYRNSNGSILWNWFSQLFSAKCIKSEYFLCYIWVIFLYISDCVFYLLWLQKEQEQWWTGFLTLAEVCPSGVGLILPSKCFWMTHFTALYQVVKGIQNQTN